MAWSFPMDWSSVNNGDKMDLLCRALVFDHDHDLHVMELVHGDGRFHLTGLLESGFESYSIFDAMLVTQYPVPHVKVGPTSCILGHRDVTWESLFSVVDMCCGFGGLAQGVLPNGFHSTVAVDHNQAMLNLYRSASNVPTICGDIGSKDVIRQVWQLSQGARTMTCGFSCQPFSALGDGRSFADPRASCLPKVLFSAFYLRVHVLILECVAPASQDQYVRGELDRFCKLTGFHCCQRTMKLDQVWPSKRNRSWWLLTSSSIGPVSIPELTCQFPIMKIEQIIPFISSWDIEDEKALSLSDLEKTAFGGADGNFSQYLMNCKGTAPCALHAWGNQLLPCPCGCRQFGLSSRRLAERGLFGLLVYSAKKCEGVIHLRHIHPCEAMALNGFDPTVDFGTDPRLTLCAIGQLASPIQVVWIMSALGNHFDCLRFGKPCFSAETHLHAYMSWMVMKCNLIWPPPEKPLIDEKLASLVECWNPVQHLSLAELTYPPRWHDKIDAPITLAAILDFLFRDKQALSETVSLTPPTNMLEPETPWLDHPVQTRDMTAEVGIEAAFCTIVFEDDVLAPVKLSPFAGTTLHEMLLAHEKLTGVAQEFRCVDAGGKTLPFDHVLEAGQVIFANASEVRSSVGTLPVPVEDVMMKDTQIDPCVSPTMTWTHPAEIPGMMKPSVFDIGECTIGLPDAQTEWLCAEPLLGLHGDQFVQLSAPQVNTTQQLWSLRHQFLKVHDRLKVLDNQGCIFSDDEIRFHLFALTQKHLDFQIKFSSDPIKRLVTIDPILTSAWMLDKGFPCEDWGKDHGFICRQSLPVASVFLLEKHWVPVSMHPVGDKLNVYVWDSDSGDHLKLNSVIERLGLSMGFVSVFIQRDRRMFFTTDLCGTSAVAYLHSTFLQVQLPSSHEETVQRLQLYREHFVQSFASCDITRRPWIWAKGDFQQESTDSIFQSLPDSPTMLTRDQRIALIAEHGSAVADDEIRFHIQHIVNRYDTINAGRELPSPVKFLNFEPLVYTCWESIGRTISARWCERHPEVKNAGVQVLTAFLLDNHWFPFWIAPHGECVTFHTMAHETIDFHRFRDVCACMGQQLGFPLFALHVIPNPLPAHNMCGTQAMMFLAHVVHGATMPSNVQDLTTLHANMRAVFVAELFEQSHTTAPVLWGNGVVWESGPLPKLPCECPFEAPACNTHDVSCSDLAVTSFDWHTVKRLLAWTFAQPCSLPMPDCQIEEVPHGADFQHAMDAAELVFHVARLQSRAVACAPDFKLPTIQVLPGIDEIVPVILDFQHSLHRFMIQIIRVDLHWIPLVVMRSECLTRIFCEAATVGKLRSICLTIPNMVITGVEASCCHDLCGAQTLDVIAFLLCGRPCASSAEELEGRRQQLKIDFDSVGSHFPLTGLIGFGPHGALIQGLASELAKHGVPKENAESRASEAIRAIGSEQLLAAMKHKQPWKQLKALGNNHKFKFVLPAELAQVVEDHKSANHAGKGKGKHGPRAPAQLELDPSKLQVLSGIFRSQNKVIPQIHPKQIGPVSSGVALMSLAEAEPYLRAAKTVSSEPLALVVLHRPDSPVQTQLPNGRVTVPCRCTIDNEPILADATLVQIGTGVVDKFQGNNLIELDSLDVVTLKYLVYRDELQCSWEEFCKAPIRFIVGTFPLLRRCYNEGCNCELWHNADQLAVKEPLLDVWRRQYLRAGFKPSTAEKADMFSVCLRVPKQIMPQLLSLSGNAGAYCEPRSADGLEVLAAYTVIWAPKMNAQELCHLKQTNPAIIGLARVGDRKGLRVLSSQASDIHKIIRPDTVYLPQGQRTLFLVGPFPFGSDRLAISKAMRQVGWECRPLQPSTPSPGRGSMWLVQAVEEPPETIVPTTHGEVVITKHRPDPVGKMPVVTPVASASTLALCGTQSKALQEDPWNVKGPWGGFKPCTVSPMDTTDSMQQMEVRVQNAVLAKLPPSPMEDDMPDRMNHLECQVQQLIAKQHGLEGQFQEYSAQQSQQMASMQTQLNTQGQQLHGHMENQNQAIQPMFAQQMEQIRGLLSKRPRDENE